MQNVVNKTNKDIQSYYIYTTNDYDEFDTTEIEIRSEGRRLPIYTEGIVKRDGVQETPFTFYNPIRTNDSLPELRIFRKMKKSPYQAEQDIVLLYPRNYGTSIKNIYILFKAKVEIPLLVQLHEIKREGERFIDEPIRNLRKKEQIDGFVTYTCSFTIQDNYIDENQLYYLLIKTP
ncbi:MAG: hypothetical protein NC094_13875 [Bacteroidales bacterium]|nr:hypothetical protein [Lachnoclostridium sp.]MCM1384214.1 hypothetical protein [Lachnoclostridium sp.]MCM1466490.1 hypothetical protein [Bacteroidales bacterium]